MDSQSYTIGTLGQATGISADTLRYYEKIGLLQDIARQGGQRRYTAQHLDQLRFIKRAQTMGFSLAEIAQLLKFRLDPVDSRDEVRGLAIEKLEAINERLRILRKLQKELKGMIEECRHGKPGACPIIKGLST